MWYWHGDIGWGSWLLMSIPMLAFWGLVIWFLLAAVRDSNGSTSQPSDPENVLAHRFAAGEIDEDEYHKRLETLRASGHTAAGRR